MFTEILSEINAKLENIGVGWQSTDDSRNKMTVVLRGQQYDHTMLMVTDIMVSRLGEINYNYEVFYMPQKDLDKKVLDECVKAAVIDKIQRDLPFAIASRDKTFVF
jgi:hypothetical protein